MGTADPRRRVAAALRSRFETTTGGDEGLAAAVAALARDEAIGPIEDEIVAESLRVRGRASRDPLGLVLTPASLAKRLVGLCTSAFPDETASATVWLDPCCGTGRLLAAAPGAEKMGWDIDPVALAVASALGRATVERLDGLATRRPPADKLGVLCNPPFVPGYSRRSAARTLDTPQLASLSRGWARGRVNVATAFVARVLRDLLRPGEIAAFVLPTPLLTAPRHATLRHALLQATDRCVVAHLGDQRFSGRAVATSFLVCRVAPPRAALEVAASAAPPAELRYAELGDDDAWTWRNIPEHDRPDADRGFAPATGASALARALAAAGHRLGDAFRVADGANPGPAVARAALLSDQPSRLSAPRAAIEGRDVLAGRVRPARRWFETDAARIDPVWRQAGTSLRDPELFAGPRLYSRQTTDRLVVGVVRDDSIALNSVHVIAPLDPQRRGTSTSIEALCGVLNTPAVSSLYRATAPLESGAFPQIRVALLRELPLPWPPPKPIAVAARAWVAQPNETALAALDAAVLDWLAAAAASPG